MIDDSTKDMIEYDLLRFDLLYSMLRNSDVEDDKLKKIETFFPDEESVFNTLVGMNARYSTLIDNFPNDIDFEKMDKMNDDEMTSQMLIYLKNVIENLNAFKRNGYKKPSTEMMPNIYINNKNDISNHNEVKVSNSIISFQDAKQQIENMSALTDNEINEIIQKINEIEKVINSNDRKSKKWENVKGIIKWVADKGFEVAKIIIPLALKIE